MNITLDIVYYLEYFFLLKEMNTSQNNYQVYIDRPSSKTLKLADLSF